MICRHCKDNSVMTTNSVSARSMYNKNDKYLIFDFVKKHSIKKIFKIGKLTGSKFVWYKVKAIKDLKSIVYTCPNCDIETVVKDVMPDYNANLTELQNVKEWLELGWVVIDDYKKLVK